MASAIDGAGGSLKGGTTMMTVQVTQVSIEVVSDSEIVDLPVMGVACGNTIGMFLQ